MIITQVWNLLLFAILNSVHKELSTIGSQTYSQSISVVTDTTRRHNQSWFICMAAFEKRNMVDKIPVEGDFFMCCY